MRPHQWAPSLPSSSPLTVQGHTAAVGPSRVPFLVASPLILRGAGRVSGHRPADLPIQLAGPVGRPPLVLQAV